MNQGSIRRFGIRALIGLLALVPAIAGGSHDGT